LEQVEPNNILNTVIMNIEIKTKKKDYIDLERLNEPKTGVLFVDFISKMIERKSKRRSEAFKSNYNSLIKHINRFSEENNAVIYTNSVNEFFLDDFICYLEARDLRLSYISELISSLKTMVRRAANYGYAVDFSYDDIVVKPEETFSVFLSMNEITRIYYDNT